MIRCRSVPQPEGFAERAERPGREWLEKNPGARRPRDYWSPFRSALADGFRGLCAYSAMYEPVGTVDHFVSWNEDRSKAYDWSNYRFASAWINASKQDVMSTLLLDPLEVEEGWFEILLPSLQLVVSSAVPAEYRARAEFVLRRLHLDHDERVIRQRRAWMEAYERGMSIEELERWAPLLARALRQRERARE